MHPHSTGTEPLRPGPLCTLPMCLYVCVLPTKPVNVTQLSPDSVAAPEKPLRAGWSEDGCRPGLVTVSKVGAVPRG